MRGILFCLFALALAQVPWIPCHCGDGCEIRPLLVAQTHTCADPDHEVLHHTCPAHGCTGHRLAPTPEPAGDPEDEGDHDHEIYILQAVACASAPTLPVGAVLTWTSAASDASAPQPRRAGMNRAGAGDATGPPAGLATVRLLV